MADWSGSQFVHSVKLPRLYKEASKVLRAVAERKGSSKTLVYQSKHRRKDALYSLVQGTLKYSALIYKIAMETELMNEERLDWNLGQVLIYELLFSKKSLPGKSKPEEKIRQYQNHLQKALKMLMKKRKTQNVDDLLEDNTAKIPRYVRINTLIATVEEICEVLRQDGYEQLEYDEDISYKKFLRLVRGLKPESYLVDLHVDSMLIFEASQTFHGHNLLEDGKIVLQDKASCFAPCLLNPPPGSTVIDACAAPGMKTSQLAAMMENSGHLIAVDLNHERVNTLKMMLDKAEVTCAEVRCADFTSLNPSEPPFCDAEYILVDPSCSGSGMISRRREGNVTDTTCSQARLRSLASFQLALLMHALSFPSVKRVVYSTCSVFPEENEQVVAEALTRANGRFLLDDALPDWPNRGDDSFCPQLTAALRTDPDRDLTGGFFVVAFQWNEDVNDDEMPKEVNVDLETATNNEDVKHLKKKKKKKKRDENE